MKKTVSSIIVSLIAISTLSLNAQEKPANVSTETPANVSKAQTEVVVNKQMIAQYQDYMENGTYISLSDALKEYNTADFKEFYNAYQDLEFTDETTMEDVKIAYEKRKEEMKKEIKTGKKPEFLTEN